VVGVRAVLSSDPNRIATFGSHPGCHMTVELKRGLSTVVPQALAHCLDVNACFDHSALARMEIATDFVRITGLLCQ
jgi:hypothetical protein